MGLIAWWQRALTMVCLVMSSFCALNMAEKRVAQRHSLSLPLALRCDEISDKQLIFTWIYDDVNTLCYFLFDWFALALPTCITLASKQTKLLCWFDDGKTSRFAFFPFDTWPALKFSRLRSFSLLFSLPLNNKNISKLSFKILVFYYQISTKNTLQQHTLFLFFAQVGKLKLAHQK